MIPYQQLEFQQSPPDLEVPQCRSTRLCTSSLQKAHAEVADVIVRRRVRTRSFFCSF